MREKKPPPPTDDIPAWFMTYSDVITLLMTFFILLLTFSTTEPEMFKKMQTTVFGAGKNSGQAGDPPEPIELNSWVLRVRPSSGRVALAGTEMPPRHTDPSPRTIGNGVTNLVEDDQQDMMLSHGVDLPLPLIVDEGGNILPDGQVAMRMLARQLRKLPFHVSFSVSHDRDLPRLIALVEHLKDKEQIRAGKIGVGLQPNGDLKADRLRIVTSWFERE